MLRPNYNYHPYSIENDERIAPIATSPERRPLGYTLQSVEVPELGEQSPGYAQAHRAFSELNELLEQNPDWRPPETNEEGTELVLDPQNIATEALYGTHDVESMRQWRLKLVPSALALETLALKTDHLPTTDTLIDRNTMDVFMFTADARSIRSRGALMSELLVDHQSKNDPAQKQRWVSLACGAARPVLEAAAHVKERRDTPIDVTLIDFDQTVLDYSAGLADDMDAVEEHREIKADLIRTMIARDTLVQELGEESMDVVDVLGYLEYCRDKQAVAMLRNSYRLVAPGGVMITANMRDDRPEKELHLRGVGWPGVRMRSSDHMVALAMAAGIDPSEIKAYQPTDGVYTVFEITKPALDKVAA